MDDLPEGALEGASHETVSAEQAASEATENTEGLTETGEPAEAEDVEDSAEEKERKSRNERRKAQKERLQRDAEEARAAREVAAREAEEARRQAREVQEQLRLVQEAAKQARPPTLAECNGDYEMYQARLSAYAFAQTFDQRAAKQLQDRIQAEQGREQAAKKAAEAAAAAEHDRFKRSLILEGQDRFPDFMAVAGNDDTPLTDDVVRLLGTTDDPVGVSYWMGQPQNRAQAKEIAALIHSGEQRSIVKAAVMIGNIQAHIANPPKPPVTSAPAPISPVRGKAVPSADPARMTSAEWSAKRASGWIPS